MFQLGLTALRAKRRTNVTLVCHTGVRWVELPIRPRLFVTVINQDKTLPWLAHSVNWPDFRWKNPN